MSTQSGTSSQRKLVSIRSPRPQVNTQVSMDSSDLSTQSTSSSQVKTFGIVSPDSRWALPAPAGARRQQQRARETAMNARSRLHRR
jgi:hypothetical protein